MFEIYSTTVHLILSLLILYFIFVGIGFWVQKLLKIQQRSFETFLFAFWIGWAVVIAFLQIWHLFFPVNLFISLVFCLIGVSGLYLNRSYLYGLLKNAHQYRVIFFVAFFLLIWLAGQAINNMPQYDDGLYHIQDTQWISSSAIVPGLGNLHGRLAFNNSFTLYVGLIDSLPLIPAARFMSNSLLMMAFSLMSIWAGWQVIYLRTERLLWHLYFLLLPMTILLSVAYASSIKNDFVIFLLSLILGGILIDLLQGNTNLKHHPVIIVALLAFVGSTIKLSIAVLAGSVLLIALWNNKREIKYVVALFVIISGVWLLRGVILSGYPIYPVSAVSIPVEWEMPVTIVDDEMASVRSWAREPHGSPSEVLGSWEWFGDWWKNTRRLSREFALPLVIACGMLLYLVGTKSIFHIRSRFWIYPAVLLLSLGYWFWSAPDVRFAIHLFWLLGAGIFLIGVDHFKKYSWVIGLTFILLADVLIQTYWASYQGNRSEFAQYETVEANNFYTWHGVLLKVPIESDQCWMAELPCTPYPNPFIALRNPDNLADGFVVRPIESDLGAFFAWNELTQMNDITPDYERDNELPVNGILIADGWHPLEVYGQDKQRWVGNTAEILITEPDNTVQTICLTAEPGPSVQDDYVEIQVMEADEVIGEYRFNQLDTLEIQLPIRDERVQRFTLIVKNEFVPAPDDGRNLNFRVTQIDWCAPAS